MDTTHTAEQRRGLVSQWNAGLEGASAEEVLRWAADTFPGKIALATSLGVEDQALLAMIAKARLGIEAFTLDTGRLLPETYELLARTTRRYSVPVHVYFPETADVEEMVRLHGIDLFRDSVAARKRCCEVRKVRPLRRAQAGLEAWVCGLRAGQAITRESVDAVEWDEAAGLVKINPLAAWSEDDVRAYVRENDVPYNALHDAGFPSIGCAPCTRAIEPGEDVRAGRWWWESAEHRECGLHAHPSAADGDASFAASPPLAAAGAHCASPSAASAEVQEHEHPSAGGLKGGDES